MKLKFKSLMVIILAWGLSLGVCRAESNFKIEAAAALLMDPVSGRVLYEQDGHKRLPPASVTKVMSMLLIMEAIENGQIKWSDKVATSTLAAGMGGSQIYLKEKEEMTVTELFKAVAVVSANDASTVLAEYIYGSDVDFINAMNERAKELGLENTNFVNETGLPASGHYSSAYDLAVMSRELLKHPKVLEFTSIWMDSLREGQFILKNTNELIRVYSGADGLKTGHTSEAKYCLSATAQRDGFRLLSVILGTDSEGARVNETKRLLDYGYRNFIKLLIHEGDKEIGEVHIPRAKQQQVAVKVNQDFQVVVNREKAKQVITELKLDNKLKLPLAAGARVGVAIARLDGEELGQTVLYTVGEVKSANILVRGWRWIWSFFKGLFD